MNFHTYHSYYTNPTFFMACYPQNVNIIKEIIENVNNDLSISDLCLGMHSYWLSGASDIEYVNVIDRRGNSIGIISKSMVSSGKTANDMVDFLTQRGLYENARRFDREWYGGKKNMLSALEIEYFLKPPGIDSRPVFSKGGPWCYTEEEWNKINKETKLEEIVENEIEEFGNEEFENEELNEYIEREIQIIGKLKNLKIK